MSEFTQPFRDTLAQVLAGTVETGPPEPIAAERSRGARRKRFFHDRKRAHVWLAFGGAASLAERRCGAGKNRRRGAIIL